MAVGYSGHQKKKAPRGAGLWACVCGDEHVSANEFGGSKESQTSDPHSATVHLQP